MNQELNMEDTVKRKNQFGRDKFLGSEPYDKPVAPCRDASSGQLARPATARDKTDCERAFFFTEVPFSFRKFVMGPSALVPPQPRPYAGGGSAISL